MVVANGMAIIFVEPPDGVCGFSTKIKMQTIATIYCLLFAEENFHYLHGLIINHKTF